MAIAKYKTYIWVILGALFLFILFNLFQEIISGERGRVRRFILQGKKAVETKNILACTEMISPDYHDKYGNDRQSLIYTAREVFGYYADIFVHIENIDIKLDDSKTEADVEVVALVVGRAQNNNTEKMFEGEKGRVKVRLVKKDKKWRLLELEFFEPITIMGQNIS